MTNNRLILILISLDIKIRKLRKLVFKIAFIYNTGSYCHISSIMLQTMSIWTIDGIVCDTVICINSTTWFSMAAFFHFSHE